MGFSDRLLDPLWRRGLDLASDFANKRIASSVQKREASGGDKKGDEVLVIFTVYFTIVLTAVFFGLVQYTLRHVVTTLALVETPASTVTVTVAEDDEESNVKLSSKEAEAEAFLGNSLPKLTVVNSKPITSKIRTTIKHITSQAGWTARWRGMGYGFIYSLVVSSVAQLFVAVMPNLPGAPIIASLLVALVGAPVHMVWTHATIALPGKSFRARWAPATFASYKNLAVPALVYEGVQLLVLYMTVCMITLFGLDIQANDMTSSQMAWAVLRGVGALVLLVAAAIFVILPAHTQLVRVEASMLPEDEDTIVPFDRTFGGKVVPKVLGGSGAIGFMDAWRSFNREARIRVIKLYLKIFAISFALIVFFVHIFAFEGYMLGLESLDNVVLSANKLANRA